MTKVQFLRSLLWCVSLLWGWVVVGVGAPLVYAAGVGALFGDEYLIAGAFFFVSMAWLTSKAIFWEEARKQPDKNIISAMFLIAGGVCFALSLFWIVHRKHSMEHPSEPQSKAAPLVPPKTESKPPDESPTEESNHPLLRRKATADFRRKDASVCTPKEGKSYPDYSSLPGGPKLERPMVVVNTGEFPMGGAEVAGNTLLFFKLVLTNRGEASIVKNWEICLVHDGKPFLYQPAEIPADGVPITGSSEKITPDKSLIDSVIKTPIEHAHTAGGWVVFKIPGTDLVKDWASGKEKIVGSMRFKDYLDHQSSFDFVMNTFSKSDIDKHKPELYVPGAPH
jgi:hypothetical protein